MIFRAEFSSLSLRQFHDDPFPEASLSSKNFYKFMIDLFLSCLRTIPSVFFRYKKETYSFLNESL